MIRRQVMSPRLEACGRGCGPDGDLYVRDGSRAYGRSSGARRDCPTCGTLWKVEIVRGLSHWRKVSDKEQARWDRKKMRKTPEYVPVLKRFWRLAG